MSELIAHRIQREAEKPFFPYAKENIQMYLFATFVYAMYFKQIDEHFV